jgi:hypothetical protein
MAWAGALAVRTIVVRVGLLATGERLVAGPRLGVLV